MQTPEHYQHQTPITVRFADLDAMGHLNHAKYLTYMEQARILYIRDVCGFDLSWEDFGVILANIICDYLQPVAFAEVITVYCRCSRIGGKSFDIDYLLVNEQNEAVATGKTVLVAFDYHRNQTIPVPDDWREKITQFEKEDM